MPTTKVRGTLTKRAVRVKQQGGRVHWMFALPGSEVHDLITREMMKVDKWSAGDEDGYQREPIPARVAKFGQFAKGPEGWSPTSCLVYARWPERVTVEEERDGVATISIEVDPEHPLYIPDGQHRFYGVYQGVDKDPTSSLTSYELPVVMMVAQPGMTAPDSRFEEAGQFYTINHFSKRVPTDLAERYRLRHLEKNYKKLDPKDQLPMNPTRDELKPYAVAIVDMLLDTGPWKGLIDLPNSGTSTRPVSQTSFVESLLPLLSVGAKYRWSLRKVTDTISAFWEAVQEKCPEATTHWNGDGHTALPHETYVLRTTAGVFSLNEVLGWLVGWSSIQADPASKATYSKLMGKDTGHFSDNWWMSGQGAPADGAASSGTGRGAYGGIAREIENELSGHLSALT
jgi:DGQHR domain-containing protein